MLECGSGPGGRRLQIEAIRKRERSGSFLPKSRPAVERIGIPSHTLNRLIPLFRANFSRSFFAFLITRSPDHPILMTINLHC
jgi:hypothetical protein